MPHDKAMSPRGTHDSLRIDRRRFCAGLVVIGASACTAPTNQIGVGSLEDGTHDFATSPNADLAGNPDDFATSGGPEDLAKSGPHDMATSGGGGSCAAGTSGGAASAIVEGTPKYVSSASAYVCRDSGGLYAVSSKCTHSGCKVSPDSTTNATEFDCPCHGATFDLNGQNPTSPAYSPLPHYALCVDSSGNIQIDKSQTVDASTRA